MCNENWTCGESMVAQDTAVAMITAPYFFNISGYSSCKMK